MLFSKSLPAGIKSEISRLAGGILDFVETPFRRVKREFNDVKPESLALVVRESKLFVRQGNDAVPFAFLRFDFDKSGHELKRLTLKQVEAWIIYRGSAKTWFRSRRPLAAKGGPCAPKRLNSGPQVLHELANWRSQMTPEERDSLRLGSVKGTASENLLVGEAAKDLAIEHLFERASVARELHAAAMLLQRGIGRVSVEEARVFAKADSRFIRADPNGALVTTREVLSVEAAMIETAVAGQKNREVIGRGKDRKSIPAASIE